MTTDKRLCLIDAITTDLLDQYYNGAEFYLVSMTSEAIVQKFHIPRRTIKDRGILALSDTHLCYPEHRIFFDSDITINDLFGDNIDNIRLSTDQHIDPKKGLKYKIISFIERPRNEEK
jgi:hypothetical protein